MIWWNIDRADSPTAAQDAGLEDTENVFDLRNLLLDEVDSLDGLDSAASIGDKHVFIELAEDDRLATCAGDRNDELNFFLAVLDFDASGHDDCEKTESIVVASRSFQDRYAGKNENGGANFSQRQALAEEQKAQADSSERLQAEHQKIYRTHFCFLHGERLGRRSKAEKQEESQRR